VALRNLFSSQKIGTALAIFRFSWKGTNILTRIYHLREEVLVNILTTSMRLDIIITTWFFECNPSIDTRVFSLLVNETNMIFIRLGEDIFLCLYQCSEMGL